MTGVQTCALPIYAYAEHFAGDPPARVAIGVAALPKGAKVEIDAIVALTD